MSGFPATFISRLSYRQKQGAQPTFFFTLCISSIGGYLLIASKVSRRNPHFNKLITSGVAEGDEGRDQTGKNESDINKSCRVWLCTLCQPAVRHRQNNALRNGNAIKSVITEEYQYLPLVVGAHIQIAQNGFGSDFVIQLLVRRSVVSWPEI